MHNIILIMYICNEINVKLEIMTNSPLFTRYALDLPTDLLDKMRNISYQRKMEKRDNRTLKAVVTELLEKGLLFANDSLETPQTASTP